MSNQAEPSAAASMADRMPALAAEFAQAQKNTGVNLDFLPRTLPLVDKYLAAKRTELQQLNAKHDPQAAEVKAAHAASIAGYLGEVIRKETGGSWYDFDGRPMLNVGDYQADPLPIVNALLQSGQARDGDVVITSTKAYCEMITRMQRVWLEGTVLGTYESMAALRTSISPDAKLAGTIVAQSQAAVQAAKLSFDESLDLSSESLEQVERIMSKLHKQATEPGPDQLTEQQLTELSTLWGIYVGEVIRRYYGGQWSTIDGVPDLTLGGKNAAPIAKVRKRITGGPMDNLKYYFTSIMKVLSSQQSQ
jgi:hypothetical protein